MHSPICVRACVCVHYLACNAFIIIMMMMMIYGVPIHHNRNIIKSSQQMIKKQLWRLTKS